MNANSPTSNLSRFPKILKFCYYIPAANLNSFDCTTVTASLWVDDMMLVLKSRDIQPRRELCC